MKQKSQRLLRQVTLGQSHYSQLCGMETLPECSGHAVGTGWSAALPEALNDHREQKQKGPETIMKAAVSWKETKNVAS